MVHRRADFFALTVEQLETPRAVRAEERGEPVRGDPAGPRRPAARQGAQQPGHPAGGRVHGRGPRPLARRARPPGRVPAAGPGRRAGPLVRGRRGGAPPDRDRGAGGAPGGRAASGRPCPRRCRPGSRTPPPATPCASSWRRAWSRSGRSCATRRGAPTAGPLAGMTVVVTRHARGVQPRGGRGRGPRGRRQAGGLGVEEDGLPGGGPRRRARSCRRPTELGVPVLDEDGFRRLLAGERPAASG